MPKQFISIIFYLLSIVVCTNSCKPYKDALPINDSVLNSRFYCNDIDAINYNIGFPGTPNDSVCVFPAYTFDGQYQLTDCLLNQNNLVVSFAVLNVTIVSLTKVVIKLENYCTNDIIIKTDRYLNLRNDTFNNQFQQYCGTDALEFSGKKFSVDTNRFKLQMSRTNGSVVTKHILDFKKL